MKSLLKTIDVIDSISYRLGLLATYFVMASALLSALNAFIRYCIGSFVWLDHNVGAGGIFNAMLSLYSRNSNSFLEGQWHLFAATVMLGAAWTLKVNEHVRVDLVYGWVTERTRTWIDLLGGIFFLLPICLLMIWLTWPWAYQSWSMSEGSSNAGGLPLWPAKMMLPLGFGFVALQGAAEIVKCVLALTTNYVREFAYEKPLQ